MKKEKQVRTETPTPLAPSQPETVVPVEYCGHITARNYWFKIGLSPQELAALRKIRVLVYEKPQAIKLSEVMRNVLITGMAHFDIIHGHMFKDCNYATQEGFAFRERYQEQLIIKAFSLKNVGIDKWE